MVDSFKPEAAHLCIFSLLGSCSVGVRRWYGVPSVWKEMSHSWERLKAIVNNYHPITQHST